MAIDKAYTLTIGGTTWALDCPKVEYSTDATIDSNVYNVFGTVATARIITKGKEKPNVVNIYIVRFTAGANCAIVFNGWELSWVGGSAPTFIDGSIYEITIIDNLAMCVNS